MIEYSDDSARIDLDRVHGWLAESYWSPGITRERVAQMIAGSHCVGAYDEAGSQIGFARMVTDRATFAWLDDVWVEEPMRGHGIGRAMIQWFLDQPDYGAMRRIMLATRDAHGVYAPLGFTPPAKPQSLMERRL